MISGSGLKEAWCKTNPGLEKISCREIIVFSHVLLMLYLQVNTGYL